MADLNRPSLASAFHNIQGRMVQLLEYGSAVAPCLKEDPRLVEELADSIVVLVVSRLDGFFNNLVSLGTRHREQAISKHFHNTATSAPLVQPADVGQTRSQPGFIRKRRQAFRQFVPLDVSMLCLAFRRGTRCSARLGTVA